LSPVFICCVISSSVFSVIDTSDIVAVEPASPARDASTLFPFIVVPLSVNVSTFSFRITVAVASLPPFVASNCTVASAVSDTSEPISKTMTVASATSATVTATKRMTPITGETASLVFLVL